MKERKKKEKEIKRKERAKILHGLKSSTVKIGGIRKKSDSEN